MPVIEVDAITLLIRLLEKAKSAYEKLPYGPVDLQAVVETELGIIVESQIDYKSHRSFLHSLNPSKRILRRMLDGIDILSDDVYHTDYPRKPLQIHNNCFPPINFCSLPPEIISKIFQNAVDNGELEDYHPSNDNIALSHINQQCRAIALSLPSLWTDISTWHKPSAVRMSLERSQLQDLKVVFYSHTDQFDLDEFYTILSKHRHRIVSFRFYSEPCFIHFRDHFANLVFPRLLTLFISASAFEDYIPLTLPDSLMPNLRNYTGPWFPPDDTRLWTQRLTHCAFFFSRFDRRLLTEGRLFLLPNCESLKLDLNRECESEQIFLPEALLVGGNPSTSPSLPKLKHLELSLDEEDHIYEATNILEYFIPTQQLQSLDLTLSNEVCHSYQLDTMLSLCNSRVCPHGSPEVPLEGLRSLRIRYEKDTYLQFFLMSTNAQCLEHLEISGTCAKSASLDRFSIAKTLKSITFDRCNDLSERDMLDLQEKFADPNQPQTFERLQFNHCGVQPTVLSRLERKMPGMIHWERNT